MAEPTFLQRLGLPQSDPRAVRDAMRQQQLMGAGRDRFARNFTLGQMGGSAVAAGIGGVQGLLSGSGFVPGAKQAALRADQADIASAVGMTTEDLQSMQQINQEFAQQGFDTGGLEGQKQAAQFVAKRAAELGNTRMLSQSLQTLTDLNQEAAEFDRLKATTQGIKAQSEAVTTATRNKTPVSAWRADGTATTGVIGDETGPGNGAKGLWHTVNGELQYEPFGPDLTLTDPAASRAAISANSSRMAFKSVVPDSDRKLLKAQITAGSQALKGYDRVLDTLVQLTERGIAQATIGKAGEISSFIGSAVNTIEGVKKLFVGGTTLNAEDRAIYNRDSKLAEDPDNAIWNSVNIPGIRDKTAAAEQLRANLIQLAYAQARLSEPSNRGLSDADIKNALVNIGASSGNPQVMMRRFMELTFEGINNVEENFEAFHDNPVAQQFGISNDEINRYAAGKALDRYRANAQALFDKYGVTFTDAGRAVFEQALAPDLSPAEEGPPDGFVGDGTADNPIILE